MDEKPREEEPKAAESDKVLAPLREKPAINQRITLAGIDWRVLAVENNKALLISEKTLEERPYNVEPKDITWEHCTLRQYLNGEFYNKLGDVKSIIAETHNNNPNNPWHGGR